MRAVLLALTAALFAACSRTEPLPRYWVVPDFKLTDRSGQPFDSTALKGKVWVADFFFTSCPGVCPILSAKVASLHQQFASEDRLRFVSISTDPGTDTPAVLRDYAAKFNADERWIFLTGEKEPIWTLSRDGFKLAVADAPGEREVIAHSTKLILVDKTGQVRGIYDGVNDERPERIVADIRQLLAE